MIELPYKAIDVIVIDDIMLNRSFSVSIEVSFIFWLLFFKFCEETIRRLMSLNTQLVL
jgi:hypothetical protein